MVGILYSKKEDKNMSYSKDITRVPVNREKARGASGEGIPVAQARGDGGPTSALQSGAASGFEMCFGGGIWRAC